MSRGARIAGALALWLGGLVVGIYLTSNSGDDGATTAAVADATETTTTTAAAAVTTPTAAPETTTVAETTTTVAPPTTTTVAATTTTAPAHEVTIQASLQSGRFALAGVVPDATTVEQLVQAATIVYGSGFESSLTVDPEAASPPWLAGASRAITLLPIIGEGSISASPDGVAVSGTAPNEAALAALTGAVEAVLGVRPDVSGVAVTNLGFPSFNARRQGNSIVLSGQLANDTVKQGIVSAAARVYGEDAVVDELTLDEGLDVPFWSYTMPGVLELFAPFPDYEINIENGITGGSLNAGANFATGSAELSEDTIAILPIAVGIMTRDPTLGMEIVGHTDSVGPASLNQTLSEDRAAAAAEWLIGAGVASERIRAFGLGETQPIADNSTAEGRALNRRVEFRFGPLEAIVGG